MLGERAGAKQPRRAPVPPDAVNKAASNAESLTPKQST
jgi:hypothetical protein